MRSIAANEPRRRVFRPGWPLTLLALPAFALLLALGTWQVQRLAWKTDLIARAQAGLVAPPVEIAAAGLGPQLDFRRVRIGGIFLEEPAIALGFATREGRGGAQLLSPLQLSDGRVLLVDRGWVAESALARLVHEHPRGAERGRPATVEGVLRWRGNGADSWLIPAPDLERRRLYAWDRAAAKRLLGREIVPAILFQSTNEPEPPAAQPGFRQPGSTAPGSTAPSSAAPCLDGPFPAPPRVDFTNNHLGYAITWYGLAAALVVFYVMLGLQRGRASP